LNFKRLEGTNGRSCCCLIWGFGSLTQKLPIVTEREGGREKRERERERERERKKERKREEGREGEERDLLCGQICFLLRFEEGD
jgi:hypothetical protein